MLALVLAAPFVVLVAIGTVSSVRRALRAHHARAEFRRECDERRAHATEGVH